MDKENISSTELEDMCELLDKLTLQQLHLIEDKMRCELNIESTINNGSFHLAKSRYIMGQNSVNFTKLPTEASPEFSASTLCESVDENGVKQLKVAENNTDSTVNPIHWFGVLVPQNLHKAQQVFQNAINFVVECVNIQLQIQKNIANIEAMKKYKSLLDIK